MDFDLSKPYCFYLNEICKIPHGSGNEKALSDFLVDFARARHLRWVRDDWNNVVIYHPAGVGYEDHPPVLLQAHLDMVCEKTAESTHDFTKDPLELYVDGDLLRARGTTLGADDGMGCAYLLALLAEEHPRRPALECCFTTGEEVGLVGAQQLKAEYFRARRMINLDGAGEVRTYVSMGGGRRVTLRLPLTWQESGGPALHLGIKGLLGGHSGGMIDRERANANQLLARVLCRLRREGIAFRLAGLCGGSKPNVIADQAEALFLTEAETERVAEVVRACQAEFAEQYEGSDPQILVELAPACGVNRTLSTEDSAQLAVLLALLPHGQIARSLAFDIPLASVNFGLLRLEEHGVELVESVRSALESWSGQLTEQITLLAERFGASVEVSDVYPGWRYEAHSPLREIMCRVYEEQTGQKLACLAGHGGNECGVFKRLIPEMDIVTSGAIYGQIHTTGEYLDLASFDRAYAFLTRFLENL